MKSVKRIIQVIAQKLTEFCVCVCAHVVCNLSGKPFIHPDGNAVVYGPATVAPAAARNPQQGKNLQQPIPALTQQQPSNHFHTQVSRLALNHKCINCRNLLGWQDLKRLFTEVDVNSYSACSAYWSHSLTYEANTRLFASLANSRLKLPPFSAVQSHLLSSSIFFLFLSSANLSSPVVL